MKVFNSISTAVLLILLLPAFAALFPAGSPASGNDGYGPLAAGIFSGTGLIAQDWQERPSRAPRAPRPPSERSPRYDVPPPPIEIDYDRPIDVHSPPGFGDPGNPGDDPETPVPLPGIGWLMIAGGAYAIKKLRSTQLESA